MSARRRANDRVPPWARKERARRPEGERSGASKRPPFAATHTDTCERAHRPAQRYAHPPAAAHQAEDGPCGQDYGRPQEQPRRLSPRVIGPRPRQEGAVGFNRCATAWSAQCRATATGGPTRSARPRARQLAEPRPADGGGQPTATAQALRCACDSLRCLEPQAGLPADPKVHEVRLDRNRRPCHLLSLRLWLTGWGRLSKRVGVGTTIPAVVHAAPFALTMVPQASKEAPNIGVADIPRETTRTARRKLSNRATAMVRLMSDL